MRVTTRTFVSRTHHRCFAVLLVACLLGALGCAMGPNEARVRRDVVAAWPGAVVEDVGFGDGHDAAVECDVRIVSREGRRMLLSLTYQDLGDRSWRLTNMHEVVSSDSSGASR